MKKLIIILIAVSCAIGSCRQADNSTTDELKHRIIGKEYTVYKGVGYRIIEVDSQEYLSSDHGICPLQK